MNKSLAKTLTTALVQFIDRERPVGSMCCSNAECESIEEMFEGECFDIIEAFIQKKLSRLTDFEQEVSDIVEYCKEHGEHVAFDYAKRHTKTLLALAREQLIKDGYIIEKKAFHDAVEKVDPEVMKEVSDNVDKANEELTEFEEKLWVVLKSEGSPIGPIEKFTNADKEVFHTYAAALLDLAKKELARRDEVITLDKLAPYDKGFQDGKAEALKDLPRWEDIRNFAYSWTSEDKTFYDDTLGQLFHKGKKLFIDDLEKLPGFKED